MLSGIPAAPRGVAQIDVTFDIDQNGIVNVSAKDLGTGKEQKITITSSSGLSSSEVDKLVKEAEANEASDQARREIIEARNNLDNLVYQTDKLLSENRDKLPASEVSEVEGKLAAAKEALDTDDISTLKAAFDDLTASSHKLAQAAYQSGGDAGAPGAEADGGGGDSGDEDIIDVEYEEA